MILTLDFETYYDQQYSLSRMSTADYILDQRFQTIMCSVKEGDTPTEVCFGHNQVADRLSRIDWSRTAMLSHNTRFDGAILAWHYGYEPALYLDTLSMARATTHWVIGRSSLAKIAEYLGLPPKGDEVVRAIGKRLENFTREELESYARYCVHDTDLCRTIFDTLRPLFPASELRLIDLVLRMYIHPQVKLNPNVLAEHLHQVRAEKAAVLARVAHIDPSTFSSNQKFAALLESYGVEVPRKISPTTGQETYALARGDREFKELLMDDAQPMEVQAVLAARINAKSTIEETRSQKLLDRSLKEWPAAPMQAALIGTDLAGLHAIASHDLPGARGVGWAPVPLKYSGARTHRLSGDDGENWQNFKRGSRIREAIESPAGYRIVHRDASQIEARMVAWLACCQKLIDAFAAGRDVYSEFATVVFGRPVNRRKGDVAEGFVGKTGILGLGYGCGPPKFRHMLFLGQGGVNYVCDEDEARRIVYSYRGEYPEIPQLWSICDILINRILEASGRPSPVASWGPITDRLFGLVKPSFDSLWLPNGMCITYPRVRVERNPTDGRHEAVYDSLYGGVSKLYGGKLTENISQALSRIVVTDIAVRMHALTGRHPFLSTHDSLDYCVPESEAEWYDRELERQFAMRPAWAPDLPLASEGGWGRTLAAAEKMENC